MVTQHIILDMTPGTKPIVNVSQYDTGARTLVFHLRQARQAFTPPDGCTAIIHGIKPDSTYFSYAAEIDGDTVVADCTEQMTACVGFAECEVRLSNSEGHVGSSNFLLNCEKSPMTGAVISDTEIAAIEQLTDRAETAASSATASATAAAESAEQAGESATTAGESADRAAQEAETASQAAEEAGESALAAAESASSASGSEASARGFAEQAEQSANDASESAQGAAQDAQTASAKASEAAASADRASSSAVDSANAANLASGYADTARTQAQAAGESASNAAGSASTASQAAATATTKAGEASDNATAANTAAGQAAGSASDASDSAAAALASERAAAQSASDIAASAAQIQTNTDNIAALQIVESTEAADITSIEDGADGVPMKSLKVYIEPQQDLHGYDNPWPAGGGKNKLSYPYRFEETTVNDCTITVDDEGVCTFSGTPTSAVVTYIKTRTETTGNGSLYLDEGDYIVNGCPAGGSSSTYRLTIIDSNGTGVATDQGVGANFTVPSGGGFYGVQIYIASGYNPNSLVIKPMIRLATETDATFAPYSNICPISGWDSVETVRTGKNLFDFVDGNVVSPYRIIPFPLGAKQKVYMSLIDKDTSVNMSGVSIGFVTTAFEAGGTLTADQYRWVFTNNTIRTNRSNTSGGVSTADGNNLLDGVLIYSSNAQTLAKIRQRFDIQITLESTATDYEPYQARTITTDLPSTVYGGVLDVVTGELTVDRAMVDLGSLTWGYLTAYGGYFLSSGIVSSAANGSTCICSLYRNLAGGSSVIQNNDGIVFVNSDANGAAITGAAGAKNIVVTDQRFTSAADFVAAVTGQTLVYFLATPTTYTLTPEEVKTLLKANNIFANAGQTAIVYVADPKTYIDNSIADAVASLT